MCLLIGVGAGVGATAAADTTDTIETEHFVIEYHDGYETEAENIAAFADDGYEVLFQKFGEMPLDDRETIVVGSMADLPCDGEGKSQGCFRVPPGTVYVADDDPQLIYHELTHLYQYRAGVISPGGTDPLEVSTEGGARYLESPDDEIASGATFRIDEDEYFTNRDAAGEEYDDLALFAEYLLAEHDREAFDVLYTESWVWPGGGSFGDELESETGTDYAEIRDGFINQLDEQEQRMDDGGAVLPAFTYDPFVLEPDEKEVTFDARTPEAVSELDRNWYAGADPDFEWDLTNDGTIDATGATVTHSDPADTVTLYADVDGQTHVAEQELLVDQPGTDADIRLLSHSPTLESPADISPTFADFHVIEDREFTATIEVENTDDVDGVIELELVDFSDDEAEVVTTKQVDVAAGETRDAEIAHAFDEAGVYDVNVYNPENHLVNARGTSEEMYVYSIDHFEPQDGEIDAEEVEIGDPVHINSEIVVTDSSVDYHAIEVTANGQIIETETYSGSEISSITYRTDYAFEEPGTYEIEINGAPIGEVTVTDEETDDHEGDHDGATDEDDAAGEDADGETVSEADDAASSADDETPGFGVGIAVVVLISTLTVLRRTRTGP